MKIGIVGLPNVGKSSLFTALTKKEVPRENYPFCTIEPNVGVTAVPDPRLSELARVSHSKKIIPTVIEFVDIAGLVKGAHEGEGLGNTFLSHIKEVDAIAHVVRAFEAENVVHVSGRINPKEDSETILLELIMSDLDVIEKRIRTLESEKRSGVKEAAALIALLQKLDATLKQGKTASDASLTKDERALVKQLNLFTAKPMLYVLNTDDSSKTSSAIIEEYRLPIPRESTIILNIQEEVELAGVADKELNDYLTALSRTETGLDTFIRASYAILGLITFFTSGEKETRAWTIKNGALAPESAGKIHSDIELGFIRAEVVNWRNFISENGWNGAKEKGLVRIEGKEYAMKDGDVCYFRFSV